MTVIYELPASRHRLLAPLFADVWIDRALIDAVLEGTQPARVFVDDADRPAAALACCPGGDYVLAGNPAPGPLRRFVRDLPREAGVFDSPAYAFFMPHVAWGDALVEDFGAAVPVFATRSFRYAAPAIDPVDRWQARGTGPGATVRRVDANLLDDLDRGFLATGTAFTVHGQEGAEITRVDLADLSLGYCAVVDDQIVSVASVMHLSSRYASLSIDTTMPARGKGFGTIACVALVEECLRHGRTPLWNCLADNAASAGTARKLGMTEGPPQRESQWRGGWSGVETSTGRWAREPAGSGVVTWRRRGR
jgi:hypothetical protein